jgi:hypothetical protein
MILQKISNSGDWMCGVGTIKKEALVRKPPKERREKA